MEKYSSYKDSGEKWLGMIPEHWECIPLKRVAEVNPSRKKKLPLDSLVGYAPMECIRNDNMTPQKEELSRLSTGLTYCEKGDVVLAKVTPCFENGNVAIVPQVDNGCCFASSELFVYRCGNIINSRFLLYYFQNKGFIDAGVTTMQGTGGLKRITTEFAKNTLVPLPSAVEQRAIVSYLDRVTGEIDRAIVHCEQLISLLNERKQIIIQQAVTKGLDPNAPLKYSGVDWIGMVPVGWEVEPFGRHFTFGKGLTITKENLQEEGIAVISYGQIHSKTNVGVTLTEDLIRHVSASYIKSSPQSLLQPNDFVFADTSEDIEGSGNMVLNDYPEQIFAGYHTVIARPHDIEFPKYYAYLFKSTAWKSQVQALVNGVKVYSIGKRNLKQSYILIPSKEEQQEIVSFLDKKVSEISQAIASTERKIALLRERKQIIINEVVTGKVKIT